MKSIWAYISEQVASTSNLNVDHKDIALTGNLVRLNDMLQYLGFNNQQAAESLAIRIRHKLLQNQSLDIPSDLLAPRQELLAELDALDSVQQTIISYAKQCNRYLIMDEPPKALGKQLWTGAKVHIEEGELAYRDNGSRMWITLPAPYASFVSTVFLGIWKAAESAANHMTKYEYIGRPAERVGELIESGALILDKTLYETLFGEAYCVIDDWKVRLMQSSR